METMPDSGVVDAGESDGGESDAGPDAGESDGGSGRGYTGLGALMPQVVSLGGPVQSPTKVLPITYDNDPNRTDIDAFVLDYAQSTAWTDQSGEYDVGSLERVGPGHLAGNAPASVHVSNLETLIETNTSGADPPWGPLDPGTTYLFFFPSTTVVHAGGTSCNSFLGYHDELTVADAGIAYGVVASCPGALGSSYDDLQVITSTANHEILEAATDPFVESDPAYYQTDDDHSVWTYVTGGEIGDMCEYASTANWQPSDMSYLIQRTWSNEEAAAGHDPCVGDGTVPYYQTVPELPDTLNLSYSGSSSGVLTKAKKIPLHVAGTLTLDVYADAPSGPFNVQVTDYVADFYGGTAVLDITEPTSPVNVGDQVQVQVTPTASDPGLSGAEVFVVSTAPVNGNGPTTFYYGFISQ